MPFRIIIEPEALEDLKNIVAFITSNDSRNRAIAFASELKESIASLSDMPMRCRKSYYLDDENTHDLIYKGYTIVFQIGTGVVHILAVFRQKGY